ILRLKGVKNTLSNSLRGRGEVYATAGTDVHLRGDNSNFSGLFNIEDGSAITISEQKQLGTAGVIDHGMLIVMTGQNWQLKNEIIGNGDLEKTGDATLTLTNAVESDHRQGDSYRSRGFTASLEAGYTFLIGEFTGREGTLNSGYVQPQVQVTWMGVKEGNHTRSDGTYIETEGDGNVQTRLGVRTYLNSYHRRDAGKQREFQPYIEANYLYNSKVYAVKMNGTKISREGSRHLAELRTGVEAKLNNNLAMWGNVGVQIGDKGYSDTQGMLGVKYSW
ncbi:autotransporter outer membrane beta-barrel domain-containing protein, partial [Escherichia albertii]|nr:autotransporter outer membrane beta-barrel domain-containing protein [Escherichia albertii]